MKKTILFFGLLSIIPFYKLGAQARSENETETMINKLDLVPLEKDDQLIDIYYGHGSLVGSLLDLLVEGDPDNVSSFNTSAVGFGMRYEFMISEDVSVGVEASYVSDILTWGDNNYNYRASREVYRIMPRVTGYLYNENNLAIFINGSIGYRSVIWAYKTNDPAYESDREVGVFPLAMRFGGGLRYFLNDNFGLHLEGGISGGRFLNGGVFVKL